MHFGLGNGPEQSPKQGIGNVPNYTVSCPQRLELPCLCVVTIWMEMLPSLNLPMKLSWEACYRVTGLSPLHPDSVHNTVMKGGFGKIIRASLRRALHVIQSSDFDLRSQSVR